MSASPQVLKSLLEDFRGSVSQEADGKWVLTAKASELVVAKAPVYRPMISAWFAEGGKALDFEFYCLLNILNDVNPSQNLPSVNFCFALIAGQLVSAATPKEVIAAITGHFDKELSCGLSIAGVEIRQHLGDSHPLLIQDLRTDALDLKARRGWLDANGLWGRNLMEYALKYDDAGAAEVYIQHASSENLLSRLYVAQVGKCPAIRMLLLGQEEAMPEELLRRLEMALSNTDPEPKRLQALDFDPRISPDFIRDNAERLQGIMNAFTGWGLDNAITRKMLLCLDDAGFAWSDYLADLVLKTSLTTHMGALDPVKVAMVQCLELMGDRPQLAGVFGCLSRQLKPIKLLQYIKDDDALLLRAYQCSRDQGFLRCVSNPDLLDDTLTEDLGL